MQTHASTLFASVLLVLAPIVALPSPGRAQERAPDVTITVRYAPIAARGEDVDAPRGEDVDAPAVSSVPAPGTLRLLEPSMRPRFGPTSCTRCHPAMPTA